MAHTEFTLRQRVWAWWQKPSPMRVSFTLGGLLTILAGAFLLSLVAGSVSIPLDAVLTILLGGQAERAVWATIVLDVRLPRAITATLAGAALAVSGVQMQTLFRNPLADPYVLGVSSGASLGVALVVLGVGAASSTALLSVAGWLNNVSITLAAVLGATTVLLLVLLVSRHIRSTITLLILGLMLGYLTSAIVSLLIAFSLSERMQAYIAWTFGSFGGVTWGQMPIFAPATLLGLGLALLHTKALNALLLGEAYASSMGLAVAPARRGIIVSAAVLAGTVTAFCGPIGFLGIAVPHFCRALLHTADHRVLLPATITLGASCALIIDVIAQLPGSNTVLPLNAMLALIGAPVVAWVIFQRSRTSAGL